MKRFSFAFLAMLLLFLTPFCQAEESTAITDSLSIVLPRNIISFTAEEAAANEQLQAVLAVVCIITGV